MYSNGPIIALTAMLTLLALVPLIVFLNESRIKAWKVANRLVLEIQRMRTPVIPPIPDAWLVADVQALQLFLKTATGQKMLQICRAQVAQDALTMPADAKDTAHVAAMAYGADKLLRYLFNMASNKTLEEISRPTGDQVEIPTVSEQSEADLVERFSP